MVCAVSVPQSSTVTPAFPVHRELKGFIAARCVYLRQRGQSQAVGLDKKVERGAVLKCWVEPWERPHSCTASPVIWGWIGGWQCCVPQPPQASGVKHAVSAKSFPMEWCCPGCSDGFLTLLCCMGCTRNAFGMQLCNTSCVLWSSESWWDVLCHSQLWGL